MSQNEWSDKELLELFVERANELESRRIWKDGGVGYRYHVQPGGPDTFERPDEELFRAYLMDLRLFVLDREPTHFQKVRGIVGRYLNPELTEQKNALLRMKKHWNHIMLQGDGRAGRFGGDFYRPIDILNNYLNGTYFHSAREHREALDDYTGSMEPLVLMVLIHTVKELTLLILELRGLIEKDFGEGWFTFPEPES